LLNSEIHVGHNRDTPARFCDYIMQFISVNVNRFQDIDLFAPDSHDSRLKLKNALEVNKKK
jgi:hypothetical protein